MKQFTSRIQSKFNKIRHSPNPVQCSSLAGQGLSRNFDTIISPCYEENCIVFLYRHFSQIKDWRSDAQQFHFFELT